MESGLNSSQSFASVLWVLETAAAGRTGSSQVLPLPSPARPSSLLCLPTYLALYGLVFLAITSPPALTTEHFRKVGSLPGAGIQIQYTALLQRRLVLLGEKELRADSAGQFRIYNYRTANSVVRYK